MKAIELDKLFVAAAGFYSDRLVPIDPKTGELDFKLSLSATQLFGLADGEVLTEDLEAAFYDVLNREDLLSEDNGFAPDSRKMMEETVAKAEQTVEAYRQETGRKYPPVYRTKIRIELEEVSSEEAEKIWLGRVRK